tara:strand:- start:16 stop:243 length:228 start_codon:yes stop_codon:yes gene_type:complete
LQFYLIKFLKKRNKNFQIKNCKKLKFTMLLTLSVSFGKNIQPFMFVTLISDKGGGFLRINKLQGALNGKEKKKGS